jgi:hypothetical protein
MKNIVLALIAGLVCGCANIPQIEQTNELAASLDGRTVAPAAAASQPPKEVPAPAPPEPEKPDPAQLARLKSAAELVGRGMVHKIDQAIAAQMASHARKTLAGFVRVRTSGSCEFAGVEVDPDHTIRVRFEAAARYVVDVGRLGLYRKHKAASTKQTFVVVARPGARPELKLEHREDRWERASTQGGARELGDEIQRGIEQALSSRLQEFMPS